MAEQLKYVLNLGADDLRSLALMRRLLPLAQVILRETVPSDPRRRRAGEQLRPLSPDEDYARRALISAGELLAVCDQMSYAVEFLSGFRSRKMRAGEVITRHDYIVYHLENHLIRIGSVLDRALLLVNLIFRLGVAERECRLPVIADNEHVAPTPSAEALRSIQKIVSPYQAQRNLIIHRRQLSVESMKSIEFFSALQKSLPIEFVDTEIQFFYSFAKTQTDKFIADKRPELLAINDEVFAGVRDLLAALEPIFDLNHTSLQAGG